MKKYGLLGYPLSHSFSPRYFNDKFKQEGIDAIYAPHPLPSLDLFTEVLEVNNFCGLNVTIPYKEQILPYLDQIDDEAKSIGAVNTISFSNGKTKGYNTDVYGFEISLLDLINEPSNAKGALVLGSGGAAKAVCFVLTKLHIPYTIVNRKVGNTSYEDITSQGFGSANLIINTTPIGMHPDVITCPDIPYYLLNENYFLYDLVYNPEITLFLSEGSKRGCKIKNGYEMLILQAEKAWQIWNQTETQIYG